MNLVLNFKATDFASFKLGDTGSDSRHTELYGILDYITAWNCRKKAVKCFLNCQHHLKCPAVS